jgi:tripartite-type tricarboxylate transporter receptor subunit TctC
VWRGFAAPKGLPKEIATQYETAIKKVWDSAGFKAFMKADNEDNGKALKSLALAK